MEDGQVRKRKGTYNRYIRTDEPVPKTTFYRKRKKISEIRHTDDIADNMTFTSSHCDTEEENFSSLNSPPIEENLSDSEFDCISVESTANEDNYTFQSDDDVKINLGNLNEPLYPSSSVSLLEAYISILAFSMRHNITKVCMQDLLHLVNLLLPPSNLPSTNHLFFSKLSSLFDNSTAAHIYCKHCFKIVCLLSDENKPDICKECTKSFDFQDSMKEGYFFSVYALRAVVEIKIPASKFDAKHYKL